MHSSTDSTQRTPFRPPPILIGVGILVVAIGFGLPRLMSGTTSESLATDTKPVEPKLSSLRSEAFTPPTVAAHSEPLSLITSLARLIGGLVIVCGLCVVITRWMAKQPPKPSGTMEVLASLAVDARCAIHLVRAGERRLLIGTDLTGVKALTELHGRIPDIVPTPAPQPAVVEIPTQTAAVREESVVVGPLSVSVPPTPPSPPIQPNREEIIAILARLREMSVSASPPSS